MEVLFILIFFSAFIIAWNFFNVCREPKRSIPKIKEIKSAKTVSIKDTISAALADCPIGYMWESEKKTIEYWEGIIATPHIKRNEIIETRAWERIDSEDPRWRFIPSKAKTTKEEYLCIRLLGPNGLVDDVRIRIDRHHGSIDQTMKHLKVAIEMKTEDMVKNLILDNEEWCGVYFKS